jgi:hypothetical protein
MPIRFPGILSAMLFCAVAGYPAAVPGHPAAGAKTISAVYTATPPHLDGKLDDAVWLNAAVVTDLHMVVPDEYTQPSEDSRILVLYDRQAIYFAARFNDREAGKVTAAINLMSPGNDVLRPSYRDPAAGRRYQFITTVSIDLGCGCRSLSASSLAEAPIEDFLQPGFPAQIKRPRRRNPAVANAAATSAYGNWVRTWSM